MTAAADALTVRPAGDGDRAAVLDIERRAFDSDTEARLVDDLLADRTARPLISLIAERNGRPVGHVLFTAISLGEGNLASASILAPLAVVPEAQRSGVGTALVRDGLARLADERCDVVLVLGDPAYYGRFGFVPARGFGIRAPYPLPETWNDAWMAQRLSDRPLPPGTPVARPARSLDRPEYWLP